jgi:hypothetical protein
MRRHCASLSHASWKNLLPLRLEGARFAGCQKLDFELF